MSGWFNSAERKVAASTLRSAEMAALDAMSRTSDTADLLAAACLQYQLNPDPAEFIDTLQTALQVVQSGEMSSAEAVGLVPLEALDSDWPRRKALLLNFQALITLSNEIFRGFLPAGPISALDLAQKAVQERFFAARPDGLLPEVAALNACQQSFTAFGRSPALPAALASLYQASVAARMPAPAPVTTPLAPTPTSFAVGNIARLEAQRNQLATFINQATNLQQTLVGVSKAAEGKAPEKSMSSKAMFLPKEKKKKASPKVKPKAMSLPKEKKKKASPKVKPKAMPKAMPDVQNSTLQSVSALNSFPAGFSAAEPPFRPMTSVFSPPTSVLSHTTSPTLSFSSIPSTGSKYEVSREGSLIILHAWAGTAQSRPSPKVLAFDLDSTLIETLSGGTFPRDAKDWQFKFESQTRQLLPQAHKAGTRIVIFTNQAGISKGKTNERDIIEKIVAIAKALGVPILAFIATQDDKYRKPSTAMWDLFVSKWNNGEVSITRSLYVGDAAGRPAAPPMRPKKDFSDTDRAFAANICIAFKTEREYFLELDEGEDFDWETKTGAELLTEASISEPVVETFDRLAQNSTAKYASTRQEMIICVACPASGKSTFVKRNLVPNGYIAVNRDTVGTMEKCKKVASDALAAGKSVVIDNTNASVSARAEFLELAAKHNVPVRCFWFSTPVALAQHLNLFRQNTGGVTHVPEIAFNIFKKNFQAPNANSEGFSEVVQIPFKPVFQSDEDLTKFLQRQ